MKQTETLPLKSSNIKRAAIIVILGILVLYVLLPKIHAFGLNGHTEFPGNWALIITAACLFTLPFLLSGLSYKLLAFSKLKLRRTVLIQSASVPLNLLLPAGIGNISINYLFLKRNGHTTVRAGLVVTVNNLLGIIANLSVLSVLVLAYGLTQNESKVFREHIHWLLVVVGVVLLLIILSAIVLSGQVRKLNQFRRNLLTAIGQYRSRKLSVFGAYLCAASQAIVTALVFWLCVKAYGIHLTYVSSFLVYAFSVLIGTIVPTPGGLGGVEASLTAGLVATHEASASVALAAVLAYRAVTYWLPVFLGVIALSIVVKLKLISKS